MWRRKVLFAIESSTGFVLTLLGVIFFANSCKAYQNRVVSSCGNIRNISCPFRLKGDPYNTPPGFDPLEELDCHNNRTVINLLNSKSFYVEAISYQNWSMRVVDPDLHKDSCFSFPLHSLSQFDTPQGGFNDYYSLGDQNSLIIFFECSAPVMSSRSIETTRSCSSNGNTTNSNSNSNSNHSYVGFADTMKVSELEDSCTISKVVWASSQGPMSKLIDNHNTTFSDIYDALHYGFDISFLSAKDICPMFALALYQPWRSNPPIGVVAGPVLIVLFIIALVYREVRSSKRKKEDQVRIEIFLKDYKAHKPTRYSYADIKKITNQFKHKLGQGGYGTVYKGKISDDILVAVKLLDIDSRGNGEQFINEVGTIGRIHHVNVVRLVGYCADGYRRALVYEFLPNNSLEKFVCSGKNLNSHFLGWEKLQQIALGIAKGIEYLHQGCAQRILHFDIKPHNILLDHNFHPKISDFGLAKLCSKEQSIVSMTAARGTMGYIAPEVFSRNFGNVSTKSDVYSFGMLLLEMVGARKNNGDGAQNTDEVYFPQWIYDRLDRGEDIGIQIEEEGDTNIAKKLTIVGLWCIMWYPVDRPSMKVVIQMLGGGDSPTMPPNPFGSTNAVRPSATSHRRPFNNELEVISE